MPKTEIYPFKQIDHELFRPMILVHILNSKTKKFQKFWALLDTGADKCLFPKGVCDLLGLDLKTGKQGSAGGIEGKDMPTWSHNFLIHIPCPKYQNLFWASKELEIGCLEHDSIPPILGWKGCMEFFNIRFNYPTKKIVIEIT